MVTWARPATSVSLSEPSCIYRVFAKRFLCETSHICTLCILQANARSLAHLQRRHSRAHLPAHLSEPPTAGQVLAVGINLPTVSTSMIPSTSSSFRRTQILVGAEALDFGDPLSPAETLYIKHVWRARPQEEPSVDPDVDCMRVHNGSLVWINGYALYS